MKIKNSLLQPGQIIRTLKGDARINSIRQNEPTGETWPAKTLQRTPPYFVSVDYLSGEYFGVENAPLMLPASQESKLTTEALINKEGLLAKDIYKFIVMRQKPEGLTVKVEFSGNCIAVSFGFGKEGIDAIRFFYLYFYQKKNWSSHSKEPEEVVELSFLPTKHSLCGGMKELIVAGILANDLTRLEESALLTLRDNYRPTFEKLFEQLGESIKQTVK